MEGHLDVLVLQLHCFERLVQQSCSSWAGPGTTWNSHAASNTGTVRRLAYLFSFVRELVEVILLQPRQAQRWIPLGNRESRCDATCFGVVPNAGHLFDMAMKAEQFRSGPRAIAWILNCERAHSMTPCALDVMF